MDHWCGSSSLNLSFPTLFDIAVNKLDIMADVWDQTIGNGSRKLNFVRALDLVVNLLNVRQKKKGHC